MADNTIQEPQTNAKAGSSTPPQNTPSNNTNNSSNNSAPLNSYSASLPSPINILQSFQNVFNELNYPVDITSLYTNVSKFYADVIKLPDVNQRIAVLSSVKIPYVDLNEDLRRHLLSAKTKEHAIVVNGMFGGKKDMEASQFYKSGKPHTVTTVVDLKQKENLKNNLAAIKTNVNTLLKSTLETDKNIQQLYNSIHSSISRTESNLKQSNNPVDFKGNKKQLSETYTQYKTNNDLVNRTGNIIISSIDKATDILNKKEVTKSDIDTLNIILKDIGIKYDLLNTYANNLSSHANNIQHMAAMSNVFLQASDYIKNNPQFLIRHRKQRYNEPVSLSVSKTDPYLKNPEIAKTHDVASKEDYKVSDFPIKVPVDMLSQMTGNQIVISELVKKSNNEAFKKSIANLSESAADVYNSLYSKWFSGLPTNFDNEEISKKVEKYNKTYNDLFNSYYAVDSKTGKAMYQIILDAIKNPSSLSKEAQASLAAIKEHTADPYIFIKSNLLLGNISEKEADILKKYKPESLVSDLFENLGKTTAYSLLYFFGEWSVPSPIKNYVRYEQPLAMAKYTGWDQNLMSIAQGMGFIGGAMLQMLATAGAGLLFKIPAVSSFLLKVGSHIGSMTSGIGTMAKGLGAYKVAASLSFAKYLKTASVSDRIVNFGRAELLSKLGSGSTKFLSYITPFEETLTYLSKYGFRGNGAELISTFVKGDLISTMAVFNEAHMERSFVRHEMEDRMKILKDTKDIYGSLNNYLSIDPENAAYLKAIGEGRADDMISDAGFRAFLLNVGVISAFNRVTHIGFMRRLMKGEGKFSATLVRKSVNGKKTIGVLKPQLYKTIGKGVLNSAIINNFEGIQEIAQDIADDYAKYASIHMDPHNSSNNNLNIPAAIKQSSKLLDGMDFDPIDYLKDTENGAFKTYWTTLVSGMLVNGIAGAPVFGIRYNRFVKRVNKFNERIQAQEEELKKADNTIKEYSELNKQLGGALKKKMTGVFAPGLRYDKLMKGQVSIDAVQDPNADHPALPDIEEMMKRDPFDLDYEDYVWIIKHLDLGSREALAEQNKEIANLLKEEAEKETPKDDGLYHLRKLMQLWYYHTALLGEETAEKTADKLLSDFLDSMGIKDPNIIRTLNEQMQKKDDQMDDKTVRKIKQINHAAKEALKLLSEEFEYRAATITKDEDEVYEELLDKFKDNKEIADLLRFARKKLPRTFLNEISDELKKVILFSILRVDKGLILDKKNIENVIGFFKSKEKEMIDGTLREEDVNSAALSDREKAIAFELYNIFKLNSINEAIFATLQKDKEDGKKPSDEKDKAKKIQESKSIVEEKTKKIFTSLIDSLQSIHQEYDSKMEKYRSDYNTLDKWNRAYTLYQLLMNVKYVQNNVLQRLNSIKNKLQTLENIELFKDEDNKSFTVYDMLTASDQQVVLKKILSHLKSLQITSDPNIQIYLNAIEKIINNESSYVKNDEEKVRILSPRAIYSVHHNIKKLLDFAQEEIKESDLQEIYKHLYWMSLVTEGLSDVLLGQTAKKVLEKMKSLPESQQLLEKLMKYFQAKNALNDTINKIESYIKSNNAFVTYDVLNLLYQFSALVGKDLVSENPYMRLLLDEDWLNKIENKQEYENIKDHISKLLALLVARSQASLKYTEKKSERDAMIKDNKDDPSRQELEKEIRETEKDILEMDNEIEYRLHVILESYSKIKPEQASNIYSDISKNAIIGIGAHLSSTFNVIENLFNDLNDFIKNINSLNRDERLALLYSVKEENDTVNQLNKETLFRLYDLVKEDEQKKILDVFNNKAREIKYSELMNHYDEKIDQILGDIDIFEYIYNKAMVNASFVNPFYDFAISLNFLNKTRAVINVIGKDQRTLEQLLEGVDLEIQDTMLETNEGVEQVKNQIQDLKNALLELTAIYDRLQDEQNPLTQQDINIIIDKILPILVNVLEKHKGLYNDRMSLVVSVLEKYNVLIEILSLLEDVGDADLKTYDKRVKAYLSSPILDYIELLKRIVDQAEQKVLNQTKKTPPKNKDKNKDLPDETKKAFNDVLEIVMRHINLAISTLTNNQIKEAKDINDSNRDTLLDAINDHIDNEVSNNKKHLLKGIKHILNNFNEYLKNKEKKDEFDAMSDEDKIRGIVSFYMRSELTLTKELNQLPSHLNEVGGWKNSPILLGILYTYAAYFKDKEIKKKEEEENDEEIPPIANVEDLKDIPFVNKQRYDDRIKRIKNDLNKLINSKGKDKVVEEYKITLNNVMRLTSEKGIEKQIFGSIDDVKNMVKDLTYYLIYATYIANDGKGFAYDKKTEIYRMIYEAVMNIWRVNTLESDSKERKNYLPILEDLMLATYVFVESTKETDVKKNRKLIYTNTRYLFDMAIYTSNEVKQEEVNTIDTITAVLRYVGMLHASVDKEQHGTILEELSKAIERINYYAFGDSKEELMSIYYNIQKALDLWGKHDASQIESVKNIGNEVLNRLSEWQMKTIENTSIFDGVNVNYKTLHNFLLSKVKDGVNVTYNDIKSLLNKTKQVIGELLQKQDVDINDILAAIDYIIKVFDYNYKDRSNNRLVMNEELKQLAVDVLNATKEILDSMQEGPDNQKQNRYNKLNKVLSKYDEGQQKKDEGDKGKQGEGRKRKPKGTSEPSPTPSPSPTPIPTPTPTPTPSEPTPSPTPTPPTPQPKPTPKPKPKPKPKPTPTPSPKTPPTPLPKKDDETKTPLPKEDKLPINRMMEIVKEQLKKQKKDKAFKPLSELITKLNDAIKGEILSATMQYLIETDENKKDEHLESLYNTIGNKVEESKLDDVFSKLDSFISLYNQC